MWTLGLQIVTFCVLLQMSSCSLCLIKGSVAICTMKNLRWVPPLPPNITHLQLQMNRIREINATSLSGLEELQELDLGQQLVPLIIRSNAFSRQRRLRRLMLHFNLGLQLEPQAFEGLSSLQNLHLDYCSLTESILKDNYLEPLSSLQTLDLFGNKINRLQPSLFFANMTNLNELNLKLNQIDQICESDLVGFQGKHFTILNLNSIGLKAMSNDSFDWQKCGNPFRGMSFQTLDLSNNGLSVGNLKQLFRVIEGTSISHVKLSGHIGKGFSFSNLPDPDDSTFEGLKNSSVLLLDLSKNRIFALKHGVFSSLKEVAVIDVSKNKVNQIHRNAFEGLQANLKLLNLSYNLLGEIYSHTFVSLTNLRVLDLSYNHIGALGYGSFSFPASLPSLDYLLLEDNKLTSQSVYSVTQFASNIMHLNIQDNRLTDLGGVYTFMTQFRRLQHLFHGGNPVMWCPLSSQVGPNNIQFLDLHSNSLQAVWAQGKCLNLFDSLEYLISLSLRLNGLQSLPQGIFNGLSSLREMDLSSNSLTYLQPDVLPKSLKVLDLSNNFIASPDPAAFHSLSSLDLAMNRFHCDINLASFLTWLNNNNITFLSPVEQLRCEFPSSFYNVSLLNYAAQMAQPESK
uniref:Toll-like receptor 5 n=1 Tax=Acanthochromis polyacanthus TaxID=80966 RepID=A0A3Q1FUT8_9TELE